MATMVSGATFASMFFLLKYVGHILQASFQYWRTLSNVRACSYTLTLTGVQPRTHAQICAVHQRHANYKAAGAPAEIIKESFQATGIKDACAFSRLPYFDLVDDYLVARSLNLDFAFEVPLVVF